MAPPATAVAEKRAIDEHARAQSESHGLPSRPPEGEPRGGPSDKMPGHLTNDLYEETGETSEAPPSDQPPMYSGPASPAVWETAPETQQRQEAEGRRYLGLPQIDYRLYGPPLFTLSADKTSIMTKVPYMSTTATALASLVRSQATVPPKPLICITGQRRSNTSTSRPPDFAIKINLMSLLVADDPRRRMNYVRCVGRGEMALRGGTKGPSTLPDVTGAAVGSDAAGTSPSSSAAAATGDAVEAWCRRYVEDRTTVKSFVLERQVANLDVRWLEGEIRSLVAATGYHGVVNVQFPVQHARVVVQSPDKVHRLFTPVHALFAGQSTYEVVKAVWPFASHKNGEPGRVCVVQSEQAWWREWRNPLLYAIVGRRVGWLTIEDKLEYLMENFGRGVGTVDWGE